MGRFPKDCRPAEYLPAGLEQDLFMTDPGKDEKREEGSHETFLPVECAGWQSMVDCLPISW